MTDNEIIKALECCYSNKVNCNECPLWDCEGDCFEELMKYDVLSLINRQKAEIERLQKELEIRPPASASFVFKLEEMQEKGKMLEAKWKADVRAEAIKEFAERLIARCGAPHWCVWMGEISEEMEEMVGDDDG